MEFYKRSLLFFTDFILKNKSMIFQQDFAQYNQKEN